MGSKERKDREREELRKLILKEATRMFLAEGYEKTSMRKIASSIEYSVGTLYLYFKNKDELFYEVQEVAFVHMLNYMKPLLDIQHPIERLRKIGETYVFFALQNPEYYDLMFIMDAPMNALEEIKEWSTGKKAYCILEQTVEECIEKGYFKYKDVKALSLMFWSNVHGMVALKTKGRIDVIEAEGLESLMRRTHDMLLDAVMIDSH
ncbi:MAG: TetR/AcrR family transcriptional regulator [Bacteroidota bacterium]